MAYQTEQSEFPEVGSGNEPVDAAGDSGALHPKRRAWVWAMITVVLVVVVMISGWLFVTTSTVPSSTHDDTVAQLEDTTVALAAADGRVVALESSRAELAAVAADLEATAVELVDSSASLEAARTQVDEARAEVASLRLSLAAIDRAVDAARVAAAVNVMTELYISPDFYEFFVDAGVPVDLGDDLIAMLDLPWETWDDYVQSDPGLVWGSRITDVDDPDLTDAFSRFIAAPIESDEELSALVEVDLRLNAVVMQQLDAAAEAAAR